MGERLTDERIQGLLEAMWRFIVSAEALRDLPEEQAAWHIEIEQAFDELLAVRARNAKLYAALRDLCHDIWLTDYGEKGSYEYCPFCERGSPTHEHWCRVTDALAVLDAEASDG